MRICPSLPPQAGSNAAFFAADHDVIVSVARCARAAASVRYFGLVSSVGADAAAGNFYMATKGKIEQAVLALGFPAAGVFRPSVLAAKRDGCRCGEWLGLVCIRYVYCCVACCCRAYAAIDVARVAQALLADSLRAQPAGTRLFDGSGQVEDAVHSAGVGRLLSASAEPPQQQQMHPQQESEEQKQST